MFLSADPAENYAKCHVYIAEVLVAVTDLPLLYLHVWKHRSGPITRRNQWRRLCMCPRRRSGWPTTERCMSRKSPTACTSTPRTSRRVSRSCVARGCEYNSWKSTSSFVSGAQFEISGRRLRRVFTVVDGFRLFSCRFQRRYLDSRVAKSRYTMPISWGFFSHLFGGLAFHKMYN